jgi:hypothetical protein
MSIPPLYLSIEPRRTETRLMLSSMTTAILKATLPPSPSDPRALGLLLDGLSSWHGAPLTAVLDADGAEVHENPGRWALLLGDLGPHIDVEWAVPITRRARSTVGGLGDFRRAHRLLATARGRR